MTIQLPHTPDGRLKCLCAGTCQCTFPDEPAAMEGYWRHVAEEHSDLRAAPPPDPHTWPAGWPSLIRDGE